MGAPPKKSTKILNHRANLFRKNLQIKVVILHLKPFRSEVKGKHSMGREFQSLVMEGKKHWA